MTAAGVLRPPRLRTIARQEQGRERHASWLELFFDLVFVVVIAELAHTLSGDLSLGGFARVAASWSRSGGCGSGTPSTPTASTPTMCPTAC